jgi:pyruvate formate lyase activating enzyme
MDAPIFGISRHRLLTDGEGVTTLVAFHGCPLRCKYCLNPQCNTSEVKIDILTPQQLYDKLKIDDIYFLVTGGGIVFGGGEPLLYSEFIQEFRQLCGSKWKIYVETSLNVKRTKIEPLIDIVDNWIIDIKDWNSEIYVHYTGCNNTQVISNLKYLLSQGLNNKIMVRVPRIPDYNTEKDVTNTLNELGILGVTHIDQFTYTKEVQRIRKNKDYQHQGKINSGKFKCEVLKSIRKHVAEYNQIPYQPRECEHTICATGCCPLCDMELKWLTEQYYRNINNK